jgi:hypothetical protein|tara:strand:+ start:511 stop:858 length:348 start_codon:yes stop_codon:yes gene_type:complete
MRNPFRRKTEEEKLYDDYSREYESDRRVYENYRNKAKKVVDEYNKANNFDDKKRIFENFFYEGQNVIGDSYSEEDLNSQFQKKMQNYAVELNTYDEDTKNLVAKRFGERARRKFK